MHFHACAHEAAESRNYRLTTASKAKGDGENSVAF
jgi:hypothetical protein